jgi:AbrB family looped-hinge helix DNA binding protein
MSKVTAKYQITIPPEVRRALHIEPGCDVGITREGDRYVLVVDPVEDIQRKWRGRFKGGRSTMEYLDEVRGSVS